MHTTTEIKHKNTIDNLTNNIIKKDFEYCIKKAEEVVEKLQNHKKSNGENIADSYIASILASILVTINKKYNITKKEYKKLPIDIVDNYKIYNDYFEYYTVLLDSRKGEMTKKQLASTVSLNDIIEKRDEWGGKKKGCTEHLILSLYTMIEPLRSSDFVDVRIFYEEVNDYNKNYMVLNDEPKLFLKIFKNVDSFGETIIDLPSELVDVIKASLKLKPRDYLITQNEAAKKNEIYGVGSFKITLTRLLVNIFGKKGVCINNFRNITVSTKIIDITPKEQIKMANNMLHSLRSQQKYIKPLLEPEIIKIIDEPVIIDEIIDEPVNIVNKKIDGNIELKKQIDKMQMLLDLAEEFGYELTKKK
jgi:hypothetical protein